jgi:hypothetical protein
VRSSQHLHGDDSQAAISGSRSDGIYTEKNNIGYEYSTIDGKDGAWALGFADLPVIDPVTHVYDDVNTVSLRDAIFRVNDHFLIRTN